MSTPAHRLDVESPSTEYHKNIASAFILLDSKQAQDLMFTVASSWFIREFAIATPVRLHYKGSILMTMLTLT